MAATTASQPTLAFHGRPAALRTVSRPGTVVAPPATASRPSAASTSSSRTHQQPHERLTSLDAGFYALESARAPMHLGWAAAFNRPPHAPSFEAIRAHIGSRLGRAPRYRQRLLEVPFGLAEPVWVDDENFDVSRHVRRAFEDDLGELVDRVMSVPLDRDRPLWELWIAERLADGRLGVVGKAHHALVDGVAAVELMALLLDATPALEPEVPQEWRPSKTPGARDLARSALRDRAAQTVTASRQALNVVRERGGLPDHAHQVLRCMRAIGHAAVPPAPPSPLNGRTAHARHLAWSSRPLGDLEAVERRFGATINDILLAASAGAVRELLLAHHEDAERLKAMVPVSVRASGERWGNRIAFLFPPLPCGEPDAVRRLSAVHEAMCARKRVHEAEAVDVVLRTLGRAPRLLRTLGARLITSPRLSNVTISNVPGPKVPLYLLGCRAEEAYPVVPLAAGHGISIGMTSLDGLACFGVYADGTRAAEADRLAVAIGEEIDELVQRGKDAASPEGTRSQVPSADPRLTQSTRPGRPHRRNAARGQRRRATATKHDIVKLTALALLLRVLTLPSYALRAMRALPSVVAAVDVWPPGRQ